MLTSETTVCSMHERHASLAHVDWLKPSRSVKTCTRSCSSRQARQTMAGRQIYGVSPFMADPVNSRYFVYTGIHTYMRGYHFQLSPRGDEITTATHPCIMIVNVKINDALCECLACYGYVATLYFQIPLYGCSDIQTYLSWWRALGLVLCLGLS